MSKKRKIKREHKNNENSMFSKKLSNVFNSVRDMKGVDKKELAPLLDDDLYVDKQNEALAEDIKGSFQELSGFIEKFDASLWRFMLNEKPSEELTQELDGIEAEIFLIEDKIVQDMKDIVSNLSEKRATRYRICEIIRERALDDTV